MPAASILLASFLSFLPSASIRLIQTCLRSPELIIAPSFSSSLFRPLRHFCPSSTPRLPHHWPFLSGLSPTQILISAVPAPSSFYAAPEPMRFTPSLYPTSDPTMDKSQRRTNDRIAADAVLSPSRPACSRPVQGRSVAYQRNMCGDAQGSIPSCLRRSLQLYNCFLSFGGLPRAPGRLIGSLARKKEELKIIDICPSSLAPVQFAAAPFTYAWPRSLVHDDPHPCWASSDGSNVWSVARRLLLDEARSRLIAFSSALPQKVAPCPYLSNQLMNSRLGYAYFREHQHVFVPHIPTISMFPFNQFFTSLSLFGTERLRTSRFRKL
ncbi:uncharacterized protein FOMMEDRAFT_149702 [Fomitiporia mediterranea MF3/22]|uniref:uncharacterized protein n=1 Tax=Fomitiporia mediterranea (strain MF3/22) TaxID=694068 RepID=UPI000440732B|nr:uncharacterized protein FOMMEDRAFT_149702 [Fomitiporia mediterranea MF3/22]EJD07198.1 hypothetical protein FOMMEDRAFT_149702 [Fomitiporia mediterranea MF3/22]